MCTVLVHMLYSVFVVIQSGLGLRLVVPFAVAVAVDSIADS